MKAVINPPLALSKMTMGAMTLEVVDIGGEPWFYASSLAKTLEYSHTPHMVRMCEDDEKGVHTVDTLGGIQEATFLNEAGFYRVVFGSKAEIAKPFKRWVMHEVLPSIRKTGQYQVHQTAKAMGVRMDFSQAQWEWLKERPGFVEIIPLALAGYDSVQISKMLNHKTPSGITARKQIEKLKKLHFLPESIERRAAQLERRIQNDWANGEIKALTQ